MMVTEQRATSRPATMLPPSQTATDGADAESGGASGFMMLLGMFSQPTATTVPAPITLMIGAGPDGQFADDVDSGDATELPATADKPAFAASTDEADQAESIDPLGMQALARVLVQSRDPRQPAPGTLYIGSDPHARHLLARVATLDGTKLLAAKGTMYAPELSAPATTAAAMIAMAAQQQVQAANAAATVETEPQAPANAPAQVLTPAIGAANAAAAATPLIDLANATSARQPMVRAVMALLNALSPATTATPSPIEKPSTDLFSGSNDGPRPNTAALQAGMPDVPQPMLRTVTVRSFTQREHDAQVRPEIAVTTRAATDDAPHSKRDDRQDNASTGTAVPQAESTRNIAPGTHTMFGDSMRAANGSVTADAPMTTTRTDAPVVKAPVPASQVTVELDPASGAGRVRVAIRGDVVHATIITGGQDATALDGQVHELRRALEARGFSEAHVSVRVTENDSPSSAAAPVTVAAPGELRSAATRDASHEERREQRDPRGPQRDPAHQQSPRRRPRREEELV